MKKKLYEITNLSKQYGYSNAAFFALSDINLDIYEGELLCILGESGSGKSTLLNLMSCIDYPTKGSIKFKGKELVGLNNKEMTELRAKEIGFVFQFFNLLDELDVYRNLTVIPTANQNKEKIVKLLKLIGIENKIDKFPRELSGGEQQRVSIARALNKSSSILLCDEPTGALDFKTGRMILELLEKVHQKTKKTIVIVTHTKEIASMCDRVVTLRSGKIGKIKNNKNKVKAKDIIW